MNIKWKHKLGDNSRECSKRVKVPTVFNFDDNNDSGIEDQKQEAVAAQLKDEGDQLAEQGQLGKALAKWQASIQCMPGSELSAHVHEERAQVFLNMDETFAAVQEALESTRLLPHWGIGFVTLSRAQMHHGQFQLAKSNIFKAVFLDPTNAEAWQELLRIQKACESFDAYMTQHPGELMEMMAHPHRCNCCHSSSSVTALSASSSSCCSSSASSSSSCSCSSVSSATIASSSVHSISISLSVASSSSSGTWRPASVSSLSSSSEAASSCQMDVTTNI
eukprot:TRINITY_DN5966_c0_g1_i1.p1 TRINITY_DN5966_c0_g1~~TRINITY_DN5966_c0_g1_i1.p1  ORF type:complete len:277 (+),score=90.21 TRINITY_DN5966_c0_g1_i1:67-897(+)